MSDDDHVFAESNLHAYNEAAALNEQDLTADVSADQLAADVPLTRAAEESADAALEAEFARLNPELHRRIAWVILEVDGLRRDRTELAARLEAAERERDEHRIEADHGHDDYEDAEAVICQIAEGRPNKRFDPWARELCQAFVDRPARTRATIAAIRKRAEAAEAALAELRRQMEELREQGLWPVSEIARQLADTRQALERIVEMGDYVYKPHEFAEIARRALAGGGTGQEPT